MLDRFRPKARPFDMKMAPDSETVQRAAAILEAYVQRAALPAPTEDGMSRAEALDVLGLTPGADEAAIRAAHRRLASLVHPDHSGSTYFMKKVDEARDTLLRPAREWPRLSNG
jgi:DnaJ-domain-containing protein 1